MHVWLAESLRRFYPGSLAETAGSLVLEAARGERIAFQCVCRTGDEDRLIAVAAQAPDGLGVTVRRVGYVPVPHVNTGTTREEIEGGEHIPGYVPDPLFPDLTVHAGPRETHAFWITVAVPVGAAPGAYGVTVVVSAADRTAALPEGGSGQAPRGVSGEPVAALTATMIVHAAILPARRDFPVSHWLHADTLCDWYRVEPFGEPFWRILALYLANMAAHGQDTVYVPLCTPPLDGVRRPMQLLGVERLGEQYYFDWALVRRWVREAQAAGLSRFEWTHLASQWGARHAIRIFEGHGADEMLLWPAETAATGEAYRAFLAQFLPAFERFLRSEGLLERSFFHLSDEPHGDEHRASYRAARTMLRDLAPWMPVMDALSDISFAQEGLVDTPAALVDVASDFTRGGFPAWAYFCCVPRGRFLNRLLDTPLPKIRMSGWLFYRMGMRGFLHWGYNYWYRSQTTDLIDPYRVADGGAWPDWAFGDPFVVYPGPVGPIDSLRWEVFAESLQDYALLQAALPPDAHELDEIRDFADFPRSSAWIAARRRQLLETLDRKS